MTATQGNLAGLSKFIFRAPRWYTSVGFALVVAAVVGIGAFDSRFVYDDAWQGVFFVGIPTVVASLGTATVDQWLGGEMTPNRSSLLALTSELVVVVILAIAAVIAFLLTDWGHEFVVHALLVALAAIFALRLTIIVAVSRNPIPIAAIPASIQTVAAAVMLAIYSGATQAILDDPTLRTLFVRPQEAPYEISLVTPGEFGILALMCVIWGVAIYGFIVVLDRPWRQSMGVSALDFMRGFIGHVAEGSRELEDFFEGLGEESVVPVTVMSVRTDDGTEKARFVLPMIHPGPMGDIGGGNLPDRVARQAEGLGFPPHATAGHDFNLVTEREVDTVIDSAAEAYEQIEYTDEATPSVRVEEGDATLTGQAFGDDALVVNSFSPTYADDVEYAVGLSAAAEARADDIDEVLLVDAHNCNDGLEGEDLGHVVPGSPRSFDLIYGAGRLGDHLASAERGSLACGVAWEKTEWGPRDGIGPLGIRVAVFEVAGQTTAYVLIDGNNMEPGLREDVIAGVDGVDRLEVMTSDNHVVNTVEAVNQVGDNVPAEELIAVIDDLVDRAVADLEPVEAGMASEQAEVTVFGNDRTEMLASTANAVVSIGVPMAILLTLGVFAISSVIFLLAG